MEKSVATYKGRFVYQLLIIAFLAFSIKGHAELSYHFRYLTIDQGLPQNTVYAITKDHYGFMWFATGNGLSRYDGYNFINYHKPDLPSNLVNALVETPDNRLWIGTTNGLAYYDQISETINYFPLLKDEEGSVNVISLFFEDEGRLWVGTSEQGLFLLRKSEKSDYEIKHFTVSAGGLPGNQVTSFLKLKDKRLLIGTNHGIGIYSQQQETISTFNYGNMENNLILSMYESREGDLWVGTFFGVWVFNPSTGREEWFHYDPYNPFSISHNRINEITQDFRGNIYLGTLGGIDIYQPESNSFISFPYKKVDEFSLNSIFVSCIYIDNEGNVWIGTEKGGVNQFSLYQKPFHYLIHQIDNPNSLSNSTINSILSDGSLIWIGTAGGGLNKYDRLNNQFTHFKTEPGNPSSINSDYITALIKSKNNYLWVGTWGGGLNKMLPNNTFQTLIPPVSNPETNYENTFISSLLYDQKDYLYIGTEGGLAILNLQTEEFLRLDNSQNALAHIREIGCLMMDSDGYVWAGTRTGLFYFPANSLHLPNSNYPDNELRVLRGNDQNRTGKGLPGNYIISLLEDKDRNIWIGTYGDGLVKLIKKDNGELAFEYFTNENGLSNDVIYSIQQDETGYIWVSTDYGLSRINPIERTIDNYFSDDGLLNDQFYWSASHKSPSGELFFGSINGLNHFYPTNFPVYPFEPNVTISSLRIFNQPVNVGTKRHGRIVLERPVFATEAVSLSYKDNIFSIEFTAMDYFHSRKVRYAYQLEGVDRDWMEVTSNQRAATYTNLKGGSYLFRVRATNSEGIWSDHEQQLTIIIRPPFWQTRWFLFLLILSIIIGAVFYIRHHTKRLLLEKTKLENMVRERTRRIEEQNDHMREQAEELKRVNTALEKRRTLIEGQKQELEEKNSEIVMQRDRLVTLNKEIESINQTRMRFFTNISHEFRTPLTLIISPVERMLKEMHLPGAAHELLLSVQRNARRLNLLIDQLLMFRRIETGNLSVRISKDDVGRFVTDVFHAFDVLAGQREISYKLKIETDESHRWFDPEKMENILYNLLSNAFKYTPEKGEITLSLREQILMKNNSKVPSLILEVKDTGMGIADEHIEKVFNRFYRTADGANIKGSGIGLSLTRELVEALHGTIMITKNKGKGSIFTVTLPCRQEDFSGAEINELPVFDVAELDNKVQVVMDNLLNSDPYMSEEIHGNDEEPIVLVVEDNKELALFIANSISGNYKVLVAPNGKIGYEMARKQSPDIIISDVMMPEMDGIEMCRQIKNNLYTSHIPVIMLSAKALIEDQLMAYKTGADDYISKPFNLDLLRAKVNNVIDSRRKMRSLFATESELTHNSVQSDSLDDKFLTKAYEILESAYSNPEFSVEMFSDQMFVSRSLLYKKLKALVDLSPNDFITVFRLKKALPLLSTRDISINEVAYNVGFNDPKYFSRVFKKFYKKTPSEYFA